MNAFPRNIVLVGFMGAGKTCVGRFLAERLGMTFVDMDDVIVEREGKPIPRIFADEGEPHFRLVERRLVRELAARGGQVVGTGGGIVLDPDNIQDFSRTGLVVCLRASPRTILERVAHDTNRPLLAGADKMAKIRDILDARRALYDAVPCRVDTDSLTVEEVAQRIIGLYRDDEGPAPTNRS